MSDKYKRKVDRRMHASGDIDDEEKIIRVNPKRRDLLNTICHEEQHRMHPDKSEEWIKKAAAEMEKNLSIEEAIRLMGKYRKKA